ncbi:flagellar biosynthetic protein FliR [Aeribacillus pallidus]|uniref:Flagellar biosynthetic protein FliR n=1 Tax=Aeribacillus pallidus TaxID=33936 RepID=A0A165YYZ1_9BACI|nr:flagellar biosynthetic protein FliR [Aeribacillus pallidus]KZN97612.1 flagellar biosynthetic protein FliR [Aeribacillus pallidus]
MMMLEYYPLFLLVFTRITAFIATLPLFSYRNIPMRFKIGMSFFLSLIIVMTIDEGKVDLDANFYPLIIKEVLIGLFIGLIAYIIMSAVHIAGSLIDFQMGFIIANIIDPQTGVQTPLIGQFLYSFALLLMLSLNGHHMLINGIVYSFQVIPPDQYFIPISDGAVAEQVLKAYSKMFLVAFQMALPIVASLFLVDLALGIVARTVPQMNVFVIGFAIKIGVSFLMMVLVLGIIFMLIQGLFQYMFDVMRTLMNLLGDGA